MVQDKKYKYPDSTYLIFINIHVVAALSVCMSVRPHLVRNITLKLQEISTRNFVGR